jgi:hypothetical protein
MHSWTAQSVKAYASQQGLAEMPLPKMSKAFSPETLGGGLMAFIAFE